MEIETLQDLGLDAHTHATALADDVLSEGLC